MPTPNFESHPWTHTQAQAQASPRLQRPASLLVLARFFHSKAGSKQTRLSPTLSHPRPAAAASSKYCSKKQVNHGAGGGDGGGGLPHQQGGGAPPGGAGDAQQPHERGFAQGT